VNTIEQIDRMQDLIEDILFTIGSHLEFKSFLSFSSTCLKIWNVRQRYKNWKYVGVFKELIADQHYKKCLTVSGTIGDYELLEYFSTVKNVQCWDFVMCEGAKNSDRKLIDYCISKGAENFDCCCSYAASVGNLELVKYFVSLGADLIVII
jgi:hypothetical protein